MPRKPLVSRFLPMFWLLLAVAIYQFHHVEAATEPDHDETHCSVCLTGANLAGALSLLAIALVFGVTINPSRLSAIPPAICWPAFRSRAPPVFQAL